MEGKHLVITCSLTIHDQVIQTHALIDCGATGIAFMDQDFARHHEIPLKELKEKDKWKLSMDEPSNQEISPTWRRWV